MLTYSFDEKSKKPLYEQLYDFIKADILSLKLKEKEKLPSKRNFAKNLAVSTITVETAYDKLASEGYIYSVAKSGYFVSSLDFYQKDFSVKQDTDAEKSKNTSEQKPNKDTEEKADLTNNSAKAALFPFSTWAHITRKIMAEKKEYLLHSSSCGGTQELRKAIARHLLQFRDLKVSDEQIIIGAGTEYLYSLIIQFLGYENTYAVEEPGYKKISSIYQAHTVKTVHIPLDDKGINIELLEESKANIAHISPSHHFPTGKVTPIERRYELLDWADKEDNRYIIEDDYDSELRLDSHPIPTLQSIDTKGKVIYINTFSKTLSSTIRVSYMVLPKRLVEKFYSKLGFYSNTVPVINQYALAAFMSEGHFEKHINRLRRHYKDLRNFFLEEIKEKLKDAQIMEEDAGLHFLLRVNTKKSDEQILKDAEKKGVKLSLLSDYYFDKSKAKEHIIVVNYSNLDKTSITKALSILRELI